MSDLNELPVNSDAEYRRSWIDLAAGHTATYQRKHGEIPDMSAIKKRLEEVIPKDVPKSVLSKLHPSVGRRQIYYNKITQEFRIYPSDIYLLAIHNGILHVAVIKRGDTHTYAIPAGHQEPNEIPPKTALREVGEELHVKNLEYSPNSGYLNPKNSLHFACLFRGADQRAPKAMYAFSFVAVLNNLIPLKAGSDAERAEWKPLGEFLGLSPDGRSNHHDVALYIAQQLVDELKTKIGSLKRNFLNGERRSLLALQLATEKAIEGHSFGGELVPDTEIAVHGINFPGFDLGRGL